MRKLFTASVCLALAVLSARGSEDPPADHVKLMKDLGAQQGAIRKGEDIEKNAQAMQVTLKQVSEFWAARKSEVGVKSAADGIEAAKALAAAAKDGNKEGLMASMKLVGGSCRGCHDAHRERVSENVYRIK